MDISCIYCNQPIEAEPGTEEREYGIHKACRPKFDEAIGNVPAVLGLALREGE